jgi:phospholipid/cholesterol/gamma-HCH transport system ATP-binding protein
MNRWINEPGACSSHPMVGVMKNALIEFKDVIKRFGDLTVLNGIDLKIYENQVTSIIGKSGAGKSVVLKHMIGLLKPDAGCILFSGKPMDTMGKGEWNRLRGGISYMFQSNALIESRKAIHMVSKGKTDEKILS